MACLNTLALLAASTINSTAQSTAVAIPKDARRWVGVLSVTTITGTSPTLDITIQHSSDGVTWVTLIAFTQLVAGSANTTFHKFAAAATDYLIPLLPYCRLSYVIGGSAGPTFNGVAVSLLFDS